MIRNLIQSCFIFLFITASLYGADLNETLINGNRQTYENLLKILPKEKMPSDEVALQKALLYKLINLEMNTAKKISLPEEPKDEDEYGSLFEKYIDDSMKKSEFESQISKIEEKIKILKESIKALKPNDPSLLTLQLQYAFYSKTLLRYQKEISFIKAQMKSIENLLDTSVKKINFNTKDISKKIDQVKQKYQKLKNKIDELEIEKERLELLSKSDNRIKNLENAIEKDIKFYNNTVLQAAAYLFLKFSDELKRKDKNVFNTAKEILSQVSMLKSDYSPKRDILTLLTDMENHHLGAIKVIAGSTKQELEALAAKIWNVITEPMFNINGTPISILKLIITIFIFVLGFIVGKLYKTNIEKFWPKNVTENNSAMTIFSNLGYYLILISSFFIALNILGVSLSSIGLVAGALSVGIGFGLQNIVSNFVSGLIIMFEQSIKVGDYIELPDGLRGKVKDIHMRSTLINTNSNIDLIVPNQNFVQNSVINWTMNDNIRRFEIPFSVAYGTNPETVINVVKNAIKKSNFKDVIETPRLHTRVIMTGMGDSSLNFELFVWLKGTEILYPKRTTSRFLILIYNALNENGIEIPFPQQDLHIRSIDEDVVFPLEIKKEDLKR